MDQHLPARFWRCVLYLGVHRRTGFQCLGRLVGYRHSRDKRLDAIAYRGEKNRHGPNWWTCRSAKQRLTYNLALIDNKALENKSI